MQALFTSCRERVFSETKLPRAQILGIVLLGEVRHPTVLGELSHVLLILKHPMRHSRRCPIDHVR